MENLSADKKHGKHGKHECKNDCKHGCGQCSSCHDVCKCRNYKECIKIKKCKLKIALKVTSDVTTYTNPGDVITFYYEITNIGDKLINRDLEVIVSGSSLLCKKKCCVAKTTHFYDRICLKPCESVTFVEKYTVVVPDLEKPYLENFVLAAFRFEDCVFLRSCEEVIQITNTDLTVQAIAPADATTAAMEATETVAVVEVKAE